MSNFRVIEIYKSLTARQKSDTETATERKIWWHWKVTFRSRGRALLLNCSTSVLEASLAQKVLLRNSRSTKCCIFYWKISGDARIGRALGFLAFGVECRSFWCKKFVWRMVGHEHAGKPSTKPTCDSTKKWWLRQGDGQRQWSACAHSIGKFFPLTYRSLLGYYL